MFEYIFTIGCFNNFDNEHINLLENIKKHTEKIIVGLYDNNIIEKLKNTIDIDSFENRKKNLEKYTYDIFIITNENPVIDIQKYISKHFNQIDEIKNSFIDKNNDKIKLIYDNFHLYGASGKYLSDKVTKKYNNNITILKIGERAKHFYEDHEYCIYNERNKKKINKNTKTKYGTLLYSKNKLPYKCKEFKNILNNKINFGGSEDNRYIIFKDDLFVIFNGISKKDNSRQIFLYNIKKSKICQLYINSYDIKKITQKNWMPYIYENNLYFIHYL